MQPRDYRWAWINHAALNLGAMVECLIHAVIPPWVDHPPEIVVSLSKGNPWQEFVKGTGLKP